MLDANGSRFSLVLGRADWGECQLVADELLKLDDLWRDPARSSTTTLVYDKAIEAVMLARNAVRFRAGRGDVMPDPALRLGAAADANGNLYAVVDGGARIVVRSVGSGTSSDFWPVAQPSAEPELGAFAPAEPPAAPAPLRMQGLAVTTDKYLVAGLVPPATAGTGHGGLLVFDLLAGGPPLELAWPAPWTLVPHDIAPRVGGGVAILDRANLRVWLLGRQLGMLALEPQVPQPADDFATADGSDTPPPPVASPPSAPHEPWFDLAATDQGGSDPVAIEVLADGAVLVLDGAGSDGFALVSLYVGRALAAQASTIVARDVVAADGSPPFVLRGFDAVLHANVPGGVQRLVVASDEGNQCLAFDLDRSGGRLVLVPDAGFLPLKRWHGVTLVATGRAAVDGDTGARYESLGRWLPLVEQRRPRYEAHGALLTPAFDAKEPGCTWHRVLLDACIPPGTAVQVASRAADDTALLPDLPFDDEPSPVLRPDGSELPWLIEGPGSATDAAHGHGTWELLLQRARGRFLQLRVALDGNELATPRVAALRAWQPRFSYAQRYLPAVYREDRASADFLERFLALFEGPFTAIEDRIASAAALFDVRTAHADTLDWLAGWLGLVLDPTLAEPRRRQLMRHAVQLFAYRGTTQALRLAVQLALSDCVPEAEFALPQLSQRQPWGVRIVEAYLTRMLPPALLGETSFGDTPRLVTPGQRWTLAEGAEGLHRRWRDWLAGAGKADATARYAPVPPSDALADDWRKFNRATLGVVPQLAQLVADAWARFAGTAVPLPQRWPEDGESDAAAQRQRWTDFLAALRRSDPRLARRLARWQTSVARRYLRVKDWADKTGANWPDFALLPPPTVLPGADAALADWAAFELLAEPIAANAHTFSVLLPISGPQAERERLEQRIDLATRIVRLGKPAHTRFDVRPYWALFRVGQVRLGLDTLLAGSSRDPALAPPLVLGSGHLGAARTALRPAVPDDRLLLEC